MGTYGPTRRLATCCDKLRENGGRRGRKNNSRMTLDVPTTPYTLNLQWCE